MNILYVSPHSPHPARSGGQVDSCNRLRALRQLGHRVHLIVTAKHALSEADREAILAVADRLTVVRRGSLLRGLLHSLFSRLPVQMAVRRGLHRIALGSEAYDVLVLDSEFPGEILRNPSLKANRVAVRVHNDEAAYQRKLSETATNVGKRLYFQMECRRMARYTPQVWRHADALWFISSDELADYKCRGAYTLQNEYGAQQSRPQPEGSLLPAALDLSCAAKPPLGNGTVLFVGSLAVPLNQDAVRWYLRHVHPRLLDVPGYKFVVAGSTLGQPLDRFLAEVRSYPAVWLQRDVPDLRTLFEASSVFVSPMQRGASVKLKTVEAVVRGLPLVATPVGIEGSGLEDGLHCRVADDPEDFAAAVRQLLGDSGAARALRDRAAEHLIARYDHAAQLRGLLAGFEKS